MMLNRIVQTDRLARNVTTCLSVLFVIAAFFGSFVIVDHMTVTHASAFRTNNLVVDELATIGSNADPLENPNRVLSVQGPWQNKFHVGSDMSEIFLQTLQGSGHPSTSDVCGVVTRNQVTFDTTSGPNQACAIYGEVTSTVSTGAGALVNYAVRGNAICGAGVTNCYSFFGDHGAVRADDGAFFGPEQVTGSFMQQDGSVTLNAGGSGGGGSGTTTILGDTHVSGHNLTVDGTAEVGSAATFDGNIRVNGTANLAGGAGLVFLQSVNSSGIPIPITNAIAPAIERITGPGASDPTLGTTTVTGSATAVTLANGTKDGQIKSFAIKSGTGTITPANLNGGTAYTWSSAPASLVLAWDATAGKWVQLAANNIVLT